MSPYNGAETMAESPLSSLDIPFTLQQSSNNNNNNMNAFSAPNNSHRHHVINKKHNSDKSTATRRPKRALSAFETFVLFELMLGTATAPAPLLIISEINFEDAGSSNNGQYWKTWTTMPGWKKQVYQDLAEADQLRYNKELALWQDMPGNNSGNAKLGDHFKGRLFNKKVNIKKNINKNAATAAAIAAHQQEASLYQNMMQVKHLEEV